MPVSVASLGLGRLPSQGAPWPGGASQEMWIIKQIFLGVDGTGDSDSDIYKADFASSHVRTLYNELSGIRYYWRGPTGHGMQTKHLGAVVADYAKIACHATNAKKGPHDMFICLAGYSRGGAAVIHACNLLKEAGLNIDCLLLFDAVDRSVNLGEVQVQSHQMLAMSFMQMRAASAGSREFFGWVCGTRHALMTKPIRPFTTTNFSPGKLQNVSQRMARWADARGNRGNPRMWSRLSTKLVRSRPRFGRLWPKAVHRQWSILSAL